MSEVLGISWKPFIRLWEESGPWGEFVIVCLVGVVVLVALSWVGSLCVRRERTRLGFWRVALVLSGLLTFAEFTGLSRLPSVARATAPVEPESPLPATGSAAPTGEVGGAPPVWLLLAWVSVFGVLGLRLIVRAILLSRHVAPLSSVDSAELQQRIDSVARTVGCRARLRVVVAPGLQSPLVFGVRHPVLVLPGDFESAFTATQQRAVLAHELGHLAQHDPFWQSVAQWMTAALWWNPAVWFLRARHAEASEAAADAEARHLPDGALLLAESLVSLGHRLAGKRVTGALSATGRVRSRLGRRVRRLLAPAPAPSKQGAGRRLVVRFVVAVIALVAVIGTTSAVRSRESGAHASPFVAIRDSFLGERRTAGVGSVPQPPAQESGNQKGTGQAPSPSQRTEAEIFDRLNLTANQRREIESALAERDAATRAMMAARSGHPERGVAINQNWHAALRRILTAEQYRGYRAYWERPTRARVAGDGPRVP